jgi:cation:H+ antiporter
VSVTGALRGSPGIAMGNVVGSNVANIGLILGACALIAAIPVARGPLEGLLPGPGSLCSSMGRLAGSPGTSSDIDGCIHRACGVVGPARDHGCERAGR